MTTIFARLSEGKRVGRLSGLYDNLRTVYVVDSLDYVSWVHSILTTVMMHIIVDKSTHQAKPHSICYKQYQLHRKCF